MPDDPQDYAHTDKNEHDRELDKRDREEEKEPRKFVHMHEDAKVRFLDDPAGEDFPFDALHPYRNDNDPEE